MPFMIIRHRVADFAKWRPLFDSHAPARRAAGLDDVHLFRDAGDPNQLVLLFKARDVEQAKAFGQSADLKERMQKAGVLGQPEIWFPNEA